MAATVENPLLAQPASAVTTSTSRPSIFKIFLGTIVTLGLIVLIVCTWNNHTSPVCYLEKFNVPGLNKASNDTQIINTTTSFDLSFSYFETRKDRRTIYYDNTNLTFSYVSNNSIQPIGNITIPEFHYLETFWQAHRAATINTSGVPWEQARIEVSNGSTAMFRVDLETKFRISNGLFWKSDRYDLRVGANVTVNDHGMKSVKHILRLSSASVHVSDCIRVAIVALLVLVLPSLL